MSATLQSILELNFTVHNFQDAKIISQEVFNTSSDTIKISAFGFTIIAFVEMCSPPKKKKKADY